MQAIMLPIFLQVSGSLILITYATLIIEKSGTKVPLKMATVLLGITQMFGSVLLTQLVDRLGRKILLVASLLGCALTHSVLAAYLLLISKKYDVEMFHWLPVACMVLAVVSSAMGITSLTFVCLVESFPIKMRSVGVTIGNLAVNIFAFVAVKMFPIVNEIIGLHGNFAFFAISCMIGCLFIVLFVPETKDKDLNVLERKMSIDSAIL